MHQNNQKLNSFFFIQQLKQQQKIFLQPNAVNPYSEKTQNKHILDNTKVYKYFYKH
ncbi:hypothetical protein pb186bvf_018044 [Paramecium bursaria]